MVDETPPGSEITVIRMDDGKVLIFGEGVDLVMAAEDAMRFANQISAVVGSSFHRTAQPAGRN